jgi:signal transduction histidine kinase/DNA-binding response OmpR family regulator/ligand-binding sensor domain-containing protein
MREGRAAATGILVILTGILGLFAGPGWAYPDVRFDQLGVADGLSQSAIQAIAQDHQGYIWIGTQYGLDRYDGHEFTHFRHDPEDPESLSNSNITSLLVSETGMLWVLTRDGLNRMDPDTGRSERIRPSDKGQGHISASTLAPEIVEDADGNLVIPSRQGLFFWDRERETLTPLAFETALSKRGVHRTHQLLVDPDGRIWLSNLEGLWRLDREALRFNRINQIPAEILTGNLHTLAAVPDGRLALATTDGLWLIDPTSGHIVERFRPTRHGRDHDGVEALVADSGGVLWLLLTDALARLDVETHDWSITSSLPANIAETRQPPQTLHAVEDGDGRLWLSGKFGLAAHDAESGTTRLFHHDPLNPDSLAPTTVNTGYRLFADDNGTIWIGGGLGGLSRFVPESARFRRIHEREAGPNVAAENIVRAVLESRDGDVWIGLDGGGLRRWTRTADGSYRRQVKYHRKADAMRRLPGNRVSALAENPHTGHIIVTTRSGNVVIDPDQDQVIAAPDFGLADASWISNLHIARDSSTLWTTTGLHVHAHDLDVDKTFPAPEWSSRIGPEDATDGAYRIFNLKQTTDGNLLVATRNGVTIIDERGESVVHLKPGGDQPEQPRNYLFGLAEQPEGTFWLGTRGGGLVRLELDEADDGNPVPELMFHTTEDGLADDTIYAIAADRAGKLWLSSNRGLMRFDPASGEVRHYTERDGLQDLEFNHGVVHTGQSGRIYFGGISGVNVFRPESIRPHPDPPRLALREVRVNERTIPVVGEEPLALELGHDENYLIIDYAGLHYVDPERIEYAYRLDGLESEWVQAGNRRQARYPGLAPGQYEFIVRAANSDGVWSENRTLLTATVQPPPWLSPIAYIAYIALAGLLILLAVAMHLRRQMALERLVDQRTAQLAEKTGLVEQQARELEEALEARTILFANISHEFRTPITLIQASLDRLQTQGNDPHALTTGRRYLNRLVRLVDQLLDLSRLRTRHHQPAATPWPLDRIVAMTAEAFRPPAGQKDIALRTRIEPHWHTRCEQELVEKILLNLLSNAVKFTPEGGQITVELEAHADSAHQVVLAVSDTGPGISEQDQQLIFERYHRIEAAENHHIQGAGIGLTLVREAVQTVGGSIRIDSQPGRGATFIVTLPAWQDGPQSNDPELLSKDSLSVDLEALEVPDEPAPQVISPQKPVGTVLIVEDNRDLRTYIRDIIAGEWNVIEAGDGKQALQQAQQHAPDLIISDIMMPDMDGLDLLKTLRADIRTSHLPVLLLTARQDDETRIKAFSIGADNYLTKPFDAEELRLRLRQMTERWKRIQAGIRRKLDYEDQTDPVEADRDSPNDQNLALSERDQQFLDSLEKWLYQNHADPGIGVGIMADAMNMDTRTLQRKLSALIGTTPAAHLRNYRLQCAELQLKHTNRTIQDIATACGFSSPQYFSRLFRQSHGISPQAWRR